MSTDTRVGAALRHLLTLGPQATRSPGGLVERSLRLYHGQFPDGDGESYALCIGDNQPVYGGDTLLEVLEGLVAQEAS